MASVLRQLSTRSSSSSAARIPISAREIPFQRIQNRKTKSLGPSRPARCQFSTSRQWMGTTEPERSSSIPAKSSSEELVTSGKDFSNELKGLSNDTRLKVGKTISILQERLPTILQKPLPNDILASNISLHLFPSTHPHLPVANGRAAYKAALWTSPIAWNRVPIIGNVGVEVQTMRVMTMPLPFTPLRIGSLDEMMVVRWITEPSSLPSEFLRGLASRVAGGEPEVHEFMGLFVFQFDSEGKILDHTIECAEHSRRWSKGVGSRVVRLTDQILGGIRGENEGTPLPAPFRACFDREKHRDDRKKE